MTTRSRITLLLAALLAASAAAAGAITDVRFQNTGAAQANVPVTFGQVFAAGDMKKSDVLVGKLDGATVPLQVDVKATHADGSVRHAIISAIVPKLAAGATGTMTINTGGTLVNEGTKSPADLLGTGFTASTSATIAGVKYSASTDQLLKAGVKATWLAGAVANEWHVSAPLTTAAGAAHPHLTARFAIRYYTAVKKARVDVTIENAWAYEPGPQNFTYDADVTVGGKSVYSKADLTHYHHARWRKVFWYGDAPAVNVQSNVPYLISSKAVPNYDQKPGVADSLLASYVAGGSVEPMGIGPATAYMPTTGAHTDIGILPSWGAAYVLSMDRRARDATMAAGDGAGSFSVHYRDRVTDRPVALADHPRMTILGRPSDAGADAFPGCGDCATPYTADTAHQPSFAYLPYLVTGDYFYLEEMQFWGMWDAFNDNPGYRGAEKGLLQPGQVRGQAWSLRTLAEAAYITPDADALKDDFTKIVDNNFDWYNATYTVGGANKLGVITNGYAFSYQGETALAPWQDDHFTSAVGHAVELGFTKAEPLLKWKAQFQIGRMLAPGFCWIDAASYNVKLRDTNASPVYETMAEVYKNSAPDNLRALGCNTPAQLALRRNAGEFASSVLNDIPGNATSATGYVSNFQPALAFAVDSGYPGGPEAWKMFATRAVRPDYSREPQFSIIPRTVAMLIAAPVAPPPAAPLVTASIVAAPTAPGTWSKIAAENAAFTVPADTLVRYGAGNAWIYSKGPGTASNEYFGKDPAVNTVKAVEAFTPAAAAKSGKVTTPSNTKLKSLRGLTASFFDPARLTQVKTFAGVTATSKGAITVADVALVPGVAYAVLVTDASGKVLDVMYPVTAQ
jgi:hypothetical protein